jgi:DNA-binding GntR family transcriptional regulator
MADKKPQEFIQGLSMSGVANTVNGYKTLQDIAYEAIRDDILSGKLPPDSPLNSSDLSRQMNISRTPIREAINKLISVGLVKQTNYKEAKVASFLSDEMHEIYYIRAALEGLAGRMSARNMTKENKQKLKDLARELTANGDKMSDEEFSANNRTFHELIYTSIKTPLIKDLIEQFYIITQRHRMVGYGISGRSRNVAAEHKEMAQYIFDGDEDNAEKLGILHHTNTIKTIEKS